MKLTAIVAMTPERVIGKEGDLPWHLPADLQFFRKTTIGHPVVMGRKTYESIGKPLARRENIVITRDPAWHANGVEIIHHPRDIKDHPLVSQQIFIIGGAQVYEFFLPMLSDLIITHVKEHYAGDTYFPEYESLFPHSELILEEEDFTIQRHYR